MKKSIVIVRVILACVSILFAFYVLFTGVLYNQSSGFNYKALFFFLILLISGIIQIFQRNVPFEMRRFKMLFLAVGVVALVILTLTVINQKEQIKKLEKTEQSKNVVK